MKIKLYLFSILWLLASAGCRVGCDDVVGPDGTSTPTSSSERTILAEGRIVEGYGLELGVDDGPNHLRNWVSEGAESLHIEYPGNIDWGAAYLYFTQSARSRIGQNWSQFTVLEIEMKGSPGACVRVSQKDTTDPDDGTEMSQSVRLSSSYQSYTFVLPSDFATCDLSRLYIPVQFVFPCDSGNNSPQTVDVRTIHFRHDLSSTPTPTPPPEPISPSPPVSPDGFLMIADGRIVENSGLDLGVDDGPKHLRDWVSEDSESLRLAYPGNLDWGVAYLYFIHNIKAKIGQDLSQFSVLEVEMRGSPGVCVLVGMKDNADPDTGAETKVPVSLTDSWYRHTFSLASFVTCDLRRVYIPVEFVFPCSSGTNGAQTVEVKSARLLEGSIPPSPPQQPTATPTPRPTPTPQPTPITDPLPPFAITFPQSGQTVNQRSDVYMQGVGMEANVSSVFVRIYTNDWYTQIKAYGRNNDGTWWKIIDLGGQDAFNNHTIEITVTYSDGSQDFDRVTGVVGNGPWYGP